ncbi:SdpI family protein [Aldersonia kunmingensis]|uniref:SdpI family protein n=1 Tax=Aldersonia kunmingensis TaxID=408066 RepID=UPI00082A9FB5|nr:SdpI family protein [Aldersonia kunmingensis]
MLVVAVVLFVLALAAVGCGVAALIGRLPRNRWVGIRTPHTMRSDAAFRVANKVAAPTTITAGVLLGVGGFAAIAFDGMLATIGVVVAVIAGVITAGNGGTLGNRAAEAITASAGAGGCGHSCGSCSLKDTCAPS